MRLAIIRKAINRYWPALLIGSVWLWIFGPMMCGAQVVGFRDSAYLYYPLFKWIDAQWAEGVMPLWNPYCNFGIPVVHDGSSSVFYPGKLIFFLRALPYPARYGLYLAIHVPVAAAGTYWFAKTLRASQAAATLAAFAFAFSGVVLFQTTNVVYLVSAAWLPFALSSAWLMFRRMQFRWALALSVFCALMILGGDPQMCYHIGLILCGMAFWKVLRVRRRYFRCLPDLRIKRSQFWAATKSITLVVTVVGVTFLLSAVQVLPTYVWSADSKRSTNSGIWERPRTLYEVADNLKILTEERIYEGVLGPPQANTHHDHLYQFSQPPWTVAELIWPNVSGRPYPIQQRWIDALPGAERMWTPSVYAGVLVFLLALCSFNPFSRNRKFAWLSRVGLFFFVASWGWYGPVWLISELHPAWVAKQNLGAPTGGLYWLMVVGLPKYVSFRYPAKLMTVAILMLCLLAGLGLDRVMRKQEGVKLAIFAGLIAALSLGLAIFSRRVTEIGRGAGSELFGPFDVGGCQSGLIFSAIVPLVVLAIGAVVWKRFLVRRRVCAVLLVLLCAFEISLANQWLVPTVATGQFESETDWAEWKESHPHGVLYRNEADYCDPGWIDCSSPQRMGEIVKWQRETLFPKHHLEYEIQLVGSFSSIEPMQQPSRWTEPFETAFQIQVFREEVVRKKKVSKDSAVDLHWRNCNQFEMQQVRISYPTWIELPIQDTPGWAIEATDLETGFRVELEDARRLKVEANQKIKVVGRYQPTELYFGLWISSLTWGVLTLFYVGRLVSLVRRTG